MTLTTLMVAGQTLVGLDDCYSRLEVDARVPGCCAHDEVPSVEDVHRSCCQSPFLADQTSSSTTTPTPDIAAAALAIVAAPAAELLEGARSDTRGFRSIVERPPDRSPPTSHTVFLI